jgi:hypothetical protein
MKKILTFLTLIFVAGIILVVIKCYLIENQKMTKVHILKFPLMLTGSGVAGKNYILPEGTTLYLDQAFPEGFVRYKLYVNVEGVDLPSETLNDPTMIDPITAYPVGNLELKKLLSEYPMTKDELASILKSGQLSKDEIKELLTEYSK